MFSTLKAQHAIIADNWTYMLFTLCHTLTGKLELLNHSSK